MTMFFTQNDKDLLKSLSKQMKQVNQITEDLSKDMKLNHTSIMIFLKDLEMKIEALKKNKIFKEKRVESIPNHYVTVNVICSTLGVSLPNMRNWIAASKKNGLVEAVKRFEGKIYIDSNAFSKWYTQKLKRTEERNLQNGVDLDKISQVA